MIENKRGLIKLKGVFVSSGSNKNDDTFLVGELSSALNTIPHQPVDIEHDKHDIVGHIVEAELFNGEKSLIKASTNGLDTHYWGETSVAPDGHKHNIWFTVTQNGDLEDTYVGQTNEHTHDITEVSIKSGDVAPGPTGHTHKILIQNKNSLQEFKLPDKTEFAASVDVSGDNSHKIVTVSYLYSNHMRGKVVDVIKRVMENKAFLSMEATFSDYDYLVGTNIVKRNEQTSFLDNFLRSNGGTGEFDGQKVKRVLRKIDFMGQGIVSNPANPDSVIISVGSVSVINTVEKKCVPNVEEKSLEKEMKEKIEKLEAANTVLEDKVEKASVEISILKNEAEAAAKDFEAKEEKYKKECSDLKAANNLIEVAHADVLKEKEALEAQVLEIRTASRMTDFDCFDIAEEDKEFIKNSVKHLDDTAYASYLERSKRLFKAKKAVVESVNEDKVAEDVIAEVEKKNNVEASVITEDKTFNEKVAGIVGKLFNTEDK